MKESIIEELFDARCDSFETRLMKREKDCYNDLNEITNKFDNILKIIPKKINQSISDEFEEIYYKIMKFSTFWNKKYYRFGMQDGFKLRNELKTNYKERIENQENFIIDYEADFNDFFEKFKVKVLCNNKEYSKVVENISKLLDKYPRIRRFCEDNKIYKFDETELDALLKLIELNETRNSIEVRNAFYLGITQKDII